MVIRPENEASRNLYTKLGFEKAFETCRVKMTPGLETNGHGTATAEDDAEKFKITKAEKRSKNDTIIDEGIEDMLAEKCDISNVKGSTDKTTDEGIEEDK